MSAIPYDLSGQQPAFEARLVEFWCEILGRPVTPEDDVLQLGASSLQIMTVIGQIADEFEVDIPVEVVFDAITIRDQAIAMKGQAYG
jgi:acyl carrier protein